MPFVHFRSGPTIVSWNSTQLGYCEDRVPVRLDPRWEDIFADSYGGQAGVPAEVQFLGATGMITLMMTKYVKAELDKLTAFTKNGTAGTLPEIGSFMRQDSLYAPLALTGPYEVKTFSVAFLRGGQEMNMSTRHKRYALSFECHISTHCARELFAITAGGSSCVP